jgi:formylglycine-generating enzyme required for sulfatase activity
VPNWTRWIAVGLVAGVALGYGIANVRADTVAVTTTWNKGDVLTADALNKNFQDLQNAINAQQVAINVLNSPDCPVGYLRDTTVATTVLCKKGADEVVRVGTGGAAFWIDRYEASIWSQADGTGTQYGLLSPSEFLPQFPIDGQYSTPLFAVSVANQQPTVYVDWYQADAACEASGKRLPTGFEWMRAARGTIDPGKSAGTVGTCLTSASEARPTGLGSHCVSKWGAEDMIGNVWEWTAEAHASLGAGTNFGSLFEWLNGDITQNVVSSAEDQNFAENSIPAVGLRGGSFTDGTWAGLYALSMSFTPTFSYVNSGFRCMVPR